MGDAMLRGPSKTAVLVAAYRARSERLCHDPWAAALAGDEGLTLSRRYDVAAPQSELWTGVRTAFLDAQVGRFVRPTGHCTQVVLLGAGLDTRAARLARPGVRFFEVDHPDTQADKLERLRALPGYRIDAAVYVRCDFEKDDFLTGLRDAGFSVEEPALLIWEGVACYLEEPVVRATLRRIASGTERRSVLVFDYFHKNLGKTETLDEKDRASRAIIEELGEPYRFGIRDPLPLLYEEGFRHVRTVSFDEACLSLTGTYDRARKFHFQSVAISSRTPPDMS
jgi:methyltransferase (TIGR00027 family)